jgi:spore coat protein CotF
VTLRLTEKEKKLLQDQKTHEEVCIQKYQNSAQQTSDSQLKQLFQSYAQQEQQHLTTITSILNGQEPMSQSQQNQSSQQMQTNQTGTSQTQAGMTASGNPADAMLCKDLLMTEKYVSNAYDTAIFEFTNSNVRQALNHIQKEEQQHGEGISSYMSSHGMYNAE